MAARFVHPLRRGSGHASTEGSDDMAARSIHPPFDVAQDMLRRSSGHASTGSGRTDRKNSAIQSSWMRASIVGRTDRENSAIQSSWMRASIVGRTERARFRWTTGSPRQMARAERGGHGRVSPRGCRDVCGRPGTGCPAPGHGASAGPSCSPVRGNEPAQLCCNRTAVPALG